MSNKVAAKDNANIVKIDNVGHFDHECKGCGHVGTLRGVHTHQTRPFTSMGCRPIAR